VTVVKLDRYRNRQTIEALESLLARAKDGLIAGLALSFRTREGFEDSVITGDYLEAPDSAAASMLRLSMKIANARGEYHQPP
jgi:hypothetical protein